MRPMLRGCSLLLATLVGACSDPHAARGARLEAPILVFGIDGLEWDVLLPLAREGKLPNITALAARGRAGVLKPLRPTLSPRLWNTIATGKLPHEHGIEGFTRKGAGGIELQYTSLDRKVKAFWNILTDHGVSCDVIGWWNTFPAERVHGLMVAQTNTPGKSRGIEKGRLLEGVAEQVWPRHEEARVLAARAASERGIEELEAEVFGDFFLELDGAKRRRWEQCDWAFRADHTYVTVLQERVARRAPSQVTAIYLGGTDVVGHRFWAAYRPADFGLDPAGEEACTFGHVVDAYHVYVDAVIGRILARFPPETTVLVVADHGMAGMPELLAAGIDEEDAESFTGGHMREEPGVFLAAGTGIRAEPLDLAAAARADFRELGALQDFCPTLLALASVPYGADMFGRPLEDVLDPAFLARHPIEHVETHDDAAWRASREVRLDLAEDPERQRQLIELGYAGDDYGEDPKDG